MLVIHRFGYSRWWLIHWPFSTSFGLKPKHLLSMQNPYFIVQSLFCTWLHMWFCCEIDRIYWICSMIAMRLFKTVSLFFFNFKTNLCLWTCSSTTNCVQIFCYFFYQEAKIIRFTRFTPMKMRKQVNCQHHSQDRDLYLMKCSYFQTRCGRFSSITTLDWEKTRSNFCFRQSKCSKYDYILKTINIDCLFDKDSMEYQNTTWLLTLRLCPIHMDTLWHFLSHLHDSPFRWILFHFWGIYAGHKWNAGRFKCNYWGQAI